jgi:putative protein-disulfide isomerase
MEIRTVMDTAFTYLFDPLCGWCYGAGPALEKLAATPGIALTLAPTGLFAGKGARPMNAEFAAYAWSNDQRIALLSGQTFSEAYRRNCLLARGVSFDSGPAILALTAVALSAPPRELDALAAIQNARYVDGRDITTFPVLSEILSGLGLNAAADRIAAPDESLLAANDARVAQAQGDMRRSGAEGVPALLVGAGQRRRLVQASALFGSLDVLIAGLQG